VKKRLIAVALAGGVALSGSVVGTLVLPSSSAHGATFSRCQKFISQDRFLDALGAEDPASPLHPALVAVEANIRNCFEKAFGPG
jgi:hypothetical protein